MVFKQTNKGGQRWGKLNKHYIEVEDFVAGCLGARQNSKPNNKRC
jgi:hypothetical protein